MKKAHFKDLLLVLNKKKPSQPMLFEFFLNEPLYRMLAKSECDATKEHQFGECSPMIVNAFSNAGYSYATVLGSEFNFSYADVEARTKDTVSLNDGNAISDRGSFSRFCWPDPDAFDYSRLEKADAFLPDGMKLIAFGPGGILENVVSLVGYDRLCYLLADSPSFVKEIFDAVGERFLRYYQICVKYDSVGALISNDDWGFKTQTLLSPDALRQYVFPWHRKIVETAHSAGKPAILHSCGQLSEVIDDIVDYMGFDGKHSYEDAIIPVEDAYGLWAERIAILGGIDLDFICRSTPFEISKRCKGMLALSEQKGGYALGTGNSVPEYVPVANYFAMIESVRQIESAK